MTQQHARSAFGSFPVPGRPVPRRRRGFADPGILVAVLITLFVLFGLPMAVVALLHGRPALPPASPEPVIAAERGRALAHELVVACEGGTPLVEVHRVKWTFAEQASAAPVAAVLTALPGDQQSRDLARNSEGVPSKPLFALTGSYSEIDLPRQARITTVEQWEALWRDHRGEGLERDAIDFELIPEVNFDEVMVVAVFLGQSQNCRGVEAVKIEAAPDGSIVIDYNVRTFQTASLIPGDGGGVMRTQPWAVWVLPKSTAPIVLRELHRQLKDAPPVPKIIGTIAGLVAVPQAGAES